MLDFTFKILLLPGMLTWQYLIQIIVIAIIFSAVYVFLSCFIPKLKDDQCHQQRLLCWKRQCGRKGDIIQDLLSGVQHYGNNHQLQAVFHCIPGSGVKSSFCISKGSVEHKLCRNTVNLFLIPLYVFDGFGERRTMLILNVAQFWRWLANLVWLAVCFPAEFLSSFI